MEALPRRVLILGLGRSGVATARYLAAERAAGADVTIGLLDEGTGPELSATAASLRSEGVPVSLATTSVSEGWDLIVASPGIPPESSLMRSARASGAPVVSEVEFAFSRARAPFVAVTGTNGKTTTTALVAHLLTGAGISAEAVGNIGSPAIAAVRDAGAASVLVAEVSSFQLSLTVGFHPKVAVLLNITPDHLDWHGSLEAYEADKVKVFANMTAGDTAVIDIDDPGSAPWADRVEARGVRVVRVSQERRPAGGAYLVDGMLSIDSATGAIPLLAVSELGIRGRHNVGNALAAAAAAIAMGAEIPAIRSGLRGFRPIEHRLEPVGAVAGVEYFNDSKATNPDAVLKALTAFDERPLIVLLGGRNKGNDFTGLAEAVAARCKRAVLFGESAQQLRAAFEPTGSAWSIAPTMEAALATASAQACPGDVVLLSPACASFDEFRSYEHR
ncbi:MAG: UDP-N-acetylmuramoyl-L-alanine--D-glutamate ligase, partial [Coriobacteriia bacterium]|nr:UDP-N-acetylmuramoyl-L-alanine--D-glutamate ligase [Coriobacteriia bacterium]